MPSTRPRVLISAPTVVAEPSQLRYAADVSGPRSGQIWFTVAPASHRQAEGQNDAFVLPAYLHALHEGCDVHFDFAVSQRLLANLADALGPLLVAFAPDLFAAPVRATAKELLWGPPTGGRPVGSATGMSCGLDSFATARYTLDFPAQSRRHLAALAHFDVGNHSPLGALDSGLYEQRRVRAAAVATQMGLPMVDVRSNAGEWIPGSFARLHTLRNASAAYLMYPLVGTYVYANGVRISDTTMQAKDSAYIDALLLPLLSTDYIEFIQGTPAWGAPEKTRAILDDPVAQAHLNVCYFEGGNCGVCEKCLRRALLIDSFGRLAEFAKVLDGRLFGENRDWYVGYVLMRERSSPVMRELADHLRASGYLADGEARYRRAWFSRRVQNWVLRRLGRARRPL